MTKNPYQAYQKKDGGGYQNTPQPGNPAYTEAWALVEAARRMAESLQSGPLDDPKVRKNMRDSLRLNWRLWTIFQSELTVGEHTGFLPEDIRLNILSLCNFVDNHTVQIMQDVTPEGIATLIDINRNIASGLLEQFSRDDDGSGQDSQAEDESSQAVNENLDQSDGLDENI